MRFKASNPEQYRRFLDAIPRPGEDPLPSSRIYTRQEKPRMAHWKVRMALHELARQGKLEVFRAGTIRYYRQHLQPQPVAPSPAPTYNVGGRNEFSLDPNVDPFVQVLAPLLVGRTVKLWMDIPQKPSNLKRAKSSKRTLVVLTPGQSFGLPREALLVSLVGKGCALLDLSRQRSVADLVLAGMSAKLAKELFNRVARLICGVNHGTSDT